ncbi:hypothetical protein TFLX_03131 [Thermoflexales bacterium]|nr:hypothetical protein TFLX_03131 [Thermoflexales bacterium]
MFFRNVMTRVTRKLIVSLIAIILTACAPVSITISWNTGNELEIAGFIIERGVGPDGPFDQVTPFIPASDDVLVGHDYKYIDQSVESGRTYWYRLLSVSNQNTLNALGMIQATAP